MIKLGVDSRWGPRRRIDDYLSKLLYGNTAGFKMNRAGRKVPVADDELTRKGVCRFDGFCGSELLSEIRARYLEVVEDPQHSTLVARKGGNGPEDEQVYRYALTDPLSTIPSLSDLLAGPLTAFLEEHYRRPFRFHSVGLWRTTHVPADIAVNDPPYSLKWHCDHHTTDTVKLFTLLSDVTDDDGPFHFLDRNRSKTILHQGFRDRHHYGIPLDVIEDPRYLQKFVGKIGDSVFCNTTECLHRAGIPAPGHTRDIMQFRFDGARE